MKPEFRRDETEENEPVELIEHWDWNTWSWKFPGTELEFNLYETIGLGMAVLLFIVGIYLLMRKDDVEQMSSSLSHSMSRSGSFSGSRRTPSAAEASLSRQISAAALSKGAISRRTVPKSTPRPKMATRGMPKRSAGPRASLAPKKRGAASGSPKKIIVEM